MTNAAQTPTTDSGTTDGATYRGPAHPGAPKLTDLDGVSSVDVVEDGAVHDEARIRYVDAHFDAVADAIDAGVDVRGHFVWSLLDNFEWAEGYTQRFGLVRVEFDDGQTRLPKDSYAWLRKRITQIRQGDG